MRFGLSPPWDSRSYTAEGPSAVMHECQEPFLSWSECGQFKFQINGPYVTMQLKVDSFSTCAQTKKGPCTHDLHLLTLRFQGLVRAVDMADRPQHQLFMLGR